MPDPHDNKKKIIVTAVIIGIVFVAAVVLLFWKTGDAAWPLAKAESAAQVSADSAGLTGSSEDGQDSANGTAGGVQSDAEGETGFESVIVESESIWPGMEESPAEGQSVGGKKSAAFEAKFGKAAEVTIDKDYRAPENFTKLTEAYPDVIGYLSIPGSKIEDAVFQSPADDTLYLNHDRDKKASSSGELYTEGKYNAPDFTDPVTVVYGHNMRSGKKFGHLQEYYTGALDNLSSEEAAEKYRMIMVSTPEGELAYTVFAAIPFDDRHIPASYDFRSPLAVYRFFSEVKKTRVIGGYVDRSISVEETDKVLILSTCMADHERRFLVMARLTGARTKE